METNKTAGMNQKVVSGMLLAIFFIQLLQPVAWSAEPVLKTALQAPQAVTAVAEVKAKTANASLPDFENPERPLSPVSKTDSKSESEARDFEEYDFEDGLEQLRPDLASAVIVKSITAQDIRKLAELEFETGIALLRGKIVLFTSGNKDEIRVLPAAQEFLEKASLLAHVHPKGERAKPSLTDIQEAGSKVEYVIGEDGVYGYSRKGLEHEYAQDYGWLVRKVMAARNEAASSKEARDILNTFIKSMDDYNTADKTGIVLRSADPVTVLPGQPVLTTSNTGSYITLDHYSSSHFRMNYNHESVIGNSVRAGINFNASPHGVQNLSALNKITFELKFHEDCNNWEGQPCARIDVVDVGNRVATIWLRDTLRKVFTQTDITKAQLLAQNPALDLTHIKRIDFVVAPTMGGGIGSMGSTGFLEVKTGGLAPSSLSPEGYPVIIAQDYDFSKVSQLPNYPVMSVLGQNGGTIGATRNSLNQYTFDYQVADADDLAINRIDFPSPQNLGSQFTFAVTGNLTGKQFQAQVIDATGKVANYYLNLRNNIQNFSLPLGGAGVPAGFDSTKIVRIQLIADKAHAGSLYNYGFAHVTMKGLAYNLPALAYNPATFTALPGQPVLTSSTAGGATMTQNQISSKNFTFNYNLPAAGATAVSEIRWGHFTGGIFVGNAGHCGGGSSMTFALSGPAGKKLKIQLVDDHSNTVDLFVTLTGVMQNYSIPMYLIPAGFNMNAMAAIRFIAENSLSRTSGQIAVETSGLFYAIPPTQALTPSDLRPLPINGLMQGGLPFPMPVEIAPQGAVAIAVQQGRGFFQSYQTGTPGWAGGGFSYDNFTTSTVETGNLSGLSNLTFGIKGMTDKLKVEIVDALGNKSSVQINGITSSEQIWSIPTWKFSGIDLTKVRMIYFIVEGQNKSGNFEVYQYPPSSNFPAFITPSEITRLPGSPTNNTVVPLGATATMSTTSRGGVLTYNTGIAGWAGGGFNYDNFSTTAIETADFSAYKKLIFGLKGTPLRVKMEVIDDQNKKAVVYLQQISNLNESEWVVETADIQAAGVNLQKIRMIYFIAEGANASGTLEINRVPTPKPIESSVPRQQLPGNPQVVKVAPASGATANVSTIARGAKLDYQTGAPGWAGVGFSYDNPATSGKESADLSQLSYVSFGFKGNTSKIKLEIVDAAGRKASIELTGIRSDSERWGAISLLPFEAYGIDLKHVTALNFIVEGQNQNGSVEIYRM